MKRRPRDRTEYRADRKRFGLCVACPNKTELKPPRYLERYTRCKECREKMAHSDKVRRT